MMETETQKKCPHCAELIQVDAKVCKHCGRDVDPKVIAANQWKILGKSMESIGCLMTIFISIPVCLCLLFFFFSSK